MLLWSLNHSMLLGGRNIIIGNECITHSCGRFQHTLAYSWWWIHSIGSWVFSILYSKVELPVPSPSILWVQQTTPDSRGISSVIYYHSLVNKVIFRQMKWQMPKGNLDEFPSIQAEHSAAATPHHYIGSKTARASKNWRLREPFPRDLTELFPNVL